MSLRLRHDPVPYDLNRRQAALQRLRYGWCHAGLSDKVIEMLPFYRFRNNFVVAKKPLTLEPHIHRGINDALHEPKIFDILVGAPSGAMHSRLKAAPTGL